MDQIQLYNSEVLSSCQQKSCRLLFADDTLIFCGAEKSQVQYLNLTLMLFQAISGLHINMPKNIIYPVNVVPDLEEMADIMYCNTDSFPTTYLGLPLGASQRSTEIWSVVIEKLENTSILAATIPLLLDRVTLINSVLDSILLHVPISYSSQDAETLDKIRRSFL